MSKDLNEIMRIMFYEIDSISQKMENTNRESVDKS